MDTTRLRRAFRYADDAGPDDDEPEVLDEEEQDVLIRTLAAQNQRRNEQFRQLLLAVPVLAMVPFLVAVVRAASRPSTRMTALLGLTSLGATTYLLYRQPPTETGIPALDAWAGARGGGGGGGSSSALQHARAKGKGVAERSLSLPSPPSPLQTHLPLLNVGLCAMLLLTLFLPGTAAATTTTTTTTTTTSPYTYRLLGSLPASVYAVVLVAKVTMAGVDPERELDRLRYEYKGA